MLRTTLALKWLRCTPLVLFEVRDVRERVRIERRRRDKMREIDAQRKAGSSTSANINDTHDLSDEAIAMECGLTPPTVFSAEEIRSSKDVVAALVKEQREKRLAKREAFLTWQAGQREKGAASRLARSAKKAERWRQHHSNEMSCKLISTSLHSPHGDGSNTNNDSNDHLLEVYSRVQGIANREGLSRMQSVSDVLNHWDAQHCEKRRDGVAPLHLSLGRGGLP